VEQRAPSGADRNLGGWQRKRQMRDPVWRRPHAVVVRTRCSAAEINFFQSFPMHRVDRERVAGGRCCEVDEKRKPGIDRATNWRQINAVRRGFGGIVCD
jgi:hypothetical protein